MTEQKHNEAEGIAFTDLWSADGWKFSLTARGNSPVEAGESLLFALNHFSEQGFSPAPDFSKAVAAVTEHASPPQDSPTAGRDLGLLEHKPKAGDLLPLDTYELEATEYKFDGKEIKFYRTGLEWPLVTHNLESAYPKEQFEKIFNGWQPEDTNDTRVPMLGGTVFLRIIGSEKLNRNGNPWHNLIGQRR